MEPLRVGARLAKATNLPTLLSGGDPDRTDARDISEAKVISIVLNKSWALKLFAWSHTFGICLGQGEV